MTSAVLPPDHPDRSVLAAEVHARPPQAVPTPSRATYVAVLVDPAHRDEELAHLTRLCRERGVEPPGPGATHFSVGLGAIALKWERHGEFSGYTAFCVGASPVPFRDTAASLLPAGWLARIPGRTIFAAHAELVPAPATGRADADALASFFDENAAVGADVGSAAGSAYTDFRIHADGFARFVLLDRAFTERQAGRMLQRLFEIEAYRMLALLALPLAREQSSRLVEFDRVLAALIAGISDEGGDDESLLHVLSRLSKDVEAVIVACQFRFGACAAYHELVRARIAELREDRIDGIQTIDEFMTRRFSPAVATVANTSRRLHDVSARVAHAFALLSTRVGIVREKQNQALLESMNRRAKLQLRLQQTVEGLSLAAILYYVVGLVLYVAKALKAAGANVQPDLLAGAVIVPLALVLVWTLRRARSRLNDG